MKHNSSLIYFVLLGSLYLSSCKQEMTSSVYYNIDSLILEQIQFLSTTRAGLRKQAEINQINQDTTFVPRDSMAWANELDIFMEIGIINKPINRGNYDRVDGLSDAVSNLTITTFSANKALPIVYLKTYYQDTPSKLRRVEALYNQENTLLTSSRKLVMEFTDLYNKNILTSYSIEGNQKMFIGDSVRFTINCSVQLN